MRGHLTDREMMEVVAGSPAGKAVTHLTHCAACRQESAHLRAALVDLAAHARAQAERPEAFWHGQRVQIAGRLGERRPLAPAWRWAWAPVLAAAGVLFLLWARHEVPPAQDANADQALLAAVERSVHADAPAPLRPALLLVSEVERGMAQSDQRITIPKGDQP